MRVALFVCFLLLPWSASADEISQGAVEGRSLAVAAVNHMPLRAAPDLDSEFVARLPLMWPITVLQEAGPEVTTNSRRDPWVRVAVPECADGACEAYRAGWVLDSHLEYDDRLERLDGLEPTTVHDDDDRYVMAYGIAADGSFSRWSAICIPGMCNLQPGPKPRCRVSETRRGAFCVMTGALYRYRDLVRGKGENGKWLPFGLRIGSNGKPCALGPDLGIDWDGAYSVVCSYSNLAPAAAVGKAMEEKGKRLALVAADMVGLRDEPSADAEITGRLPLGTAATVYGPAGSLATVDGASGRWVRAWVMHCGKAVDGCLERSSGWLIDGVLAFVDRLEPMQGWREGVIGGRRGDRIFRYQTARDGTVRFSETCDDPAECGGTTASGRLYRYKSLVVARFGSIGRVDILHIDEDGALCLPEAANGSVSYEFRDGRPSRCDR